MKYQLEIFVEGQRLDTFDYEALNLKKSVKDFRDISKVFTSFSRSITVPASKVNNRVFKHYHNLTISGNGFDGRQMVKAELKINGISLEKGRISIESAKKRFGEIQSYTIRFYGGLSEFKKRIGSDYLHNLDLSSLDISNLNMSDELDGNLTDTGVIFMLSSLKNRFIYDLGSQTGSVGDLENTKNIAYVGNNTTNDLRYGITSEDPVGTLDCGNILDAIESKYNLTLTGAVRNRYISNYRLCLNAASRDITADAINNYDVLSLGTAGTEFSIATPHFDGVYNTNFLANFAANHGTASRKIASISDDTNSITLESDFGTGYRTIKLTEDRNPLAVKNRQVNVSQSLGVCCQTSLSNFEVDVLVDGEVVSTVSNNVAQDTSTAWFDIALGRTTDTIVPVRFTGNEQKVTFRARAQGTGNITISYRFNSDFRGAFGGSDSLLANTGLKRTAYSTKLLTVTDSGDVIYRVANQLPKMKTKDFFGVLIKQFNLVPEVTINDSGTHEINFKHYDYYINQGESYDIGDYVDIDTETVKPNNYYSGIDFKHEKPVFALQEAFYRVNNRSFGDLRYEFSEDNMRINGDIFEMSIPTHKVPVERLTEISSGQPSIHQWMQLTDLNNGRQAGIVFTYIARNSGTSTSTRVAFNNGSSIETPNFLWMPTNTYISTTSGLDTDGLVGNYWGQENNERTGDSRYSGLGHLDLFYSSYLALMFDIRTRKVELSAYLPEKMMLDLNTNDRLNINDRVFLIDTIQTNFGTGKTKLTLIELTKELLSQFDTSTKTVEVTSDSSTNALKYVYMSNSGEISLGGLFTSEGSTEDVETIGEIRNYIYY